MEKYTQFRDRGEMLVKISHVASWPSTTDRLLGGRVTGSGIAPFFPISTPSSGFYLPLHIILCIVRVPLLLSAFLAYVVICSWMPSGVFIKKAILWLVLGISGMWWVDLQIDGVKRGFVYLFRSGPALPFRF